MSEREPNPFREIGSQQPDKENAPEQELSPEAIEQLMESVQDIHTPGNAYTVLVNRGKDSGSSRYGMLQEILKTGLLGTKQNYEEINPIAWKQNVTQERKGHVHFNIVGRSRNHVGGDDRLLDSSIKRKPPLPVPAERAMRYNYWLQGHLEQNIKDKPIDLIITFDISDYEELFGGESTQNREASSEKTHTFRHNDSWPWLSSDKVQEVRRVIEEGDQENIAALKQDPYYRIYFTPDGKPIPSSEYGFVLSHRVAPRKLKGVVMSVDPPTENHVTGKFHILPPEEIKGEARKIANAMIEATQEGGKAILPIYDIAGNLWWPKQMSYKEVKRFVAEKKKSKQ